MTKKELEKEFPIDTKVKLTAPMVGETKETGVPVGTIGTVTGIDDLPSLLVRWQTGSNLKLLPEVDNFVKIDKSRLQYEILSIFVKVDASDISGIKTVLPSTFFVKRTGFKKSAVLEALHTLRDKGFIQNDCLGRPAVVSGYEYQELVSEAMPPIRGFSLTKKALETPLYGWEEEKFNKSLSDWAEGKDENEK